MNECEEVLEGIRNFQKSVTEARIMKEIPTAVKVYRMLFSEKPGFKYRNKEYYIERTTSKIGVPVASVTLEMDGNKYLFTTQTSDTHSMWAKLVRLTFTPGQKIQDLENKIMWVMDLQEKDKTKRWMGIMWNGALVVFDDEKKYVCAYSHLEEPVIPKVASPVLPAAALDDKSDDEYDESQFAEECPEDVGDYYDEQEVVDCYESEE